MLLFSLKWFEICIYALRFNLRAFILQVVVVAGAVALCVIMSLYCCALLFCRS